MISKSYKLNKELVSEFAKVCEAAGVAQSAQISEMMKEFIEKNKNKRLVLRGHFYVLY